MQTFRQDRAEMVSELRRMTRLTFEIVSGFVCGLMTRTQFGHGGSLRALFGQMVCATFIGGREESIYDTPKAWFLKMLTKLRYHVRNSTRQTARYWMAPRPSEGKLKLFERLSPSTKKPKELRTPSMLLFGR